MGWSYKFVLKKDSGGYHAWMREIITSYGYTVYLFLCGNMSFQGYMVESNDIIKEKNLELNHQVHR
jgi:hypothetical protein